MSKITIMERDIIKKMKYLVKLITFITIFFLAVFLFTGDSFAKSYSIDKTNILVTINPNGSAEVKETRLFNFDGDFTFAYEYLNKTAVQQKSTGRAEGYLMDNFHLCDEIECYRELLNSEITSAEEQKPEGTFFVRDEGDKYLIKWFYRSSSSKTFTLTYVIKNAITLQKDTAEFYWKLISGSWGTSHRSISADVVLPKGVDGNSIQAWAHGPTSGRVAIPDAKTVRYTLDLLPDNNYFEARIVLPKEVFSSGARGEFSKSDIISQEEGFIKDTEAKAAKIRTIAKIGSFIGLILIAVNVMYLFRRTKVFLKYGKELKLPTVSLSGRLWDPPSEIDPAQIEQLISTTKTLSPKSFTATILSLVQKRVFKIVRSDKKEGFIFKDYKYYLVPVTSKKKVKLSSIQKSVSDFILDNIGIKNIMIEGKTIEAIPLEEIVSWCKANRTKAYNFFQKLQDIAFSESLAEGYFEVKSHEIQKDYKPILISVLLSMLNIFFSSFLFVSLSIFSSLMGVFLILLTFFLFFSLISFKVYAEKRTSKGAEETAKWLAFKKHLEEYNQTKNSPIDSVILWEKYLVYGTILGVSTKTLASLPVDFSDAKDAYYLGYWGGSSVNVSSFTDSIGSISSALSSISSAAASSYGASGVGSSGGASGVGSSGGASGGGGGGGGAG